MKLVVESGATKSVYVVVECDAQRGIRVDGPGINVSAMAIDQVVSRLSDALASFKGLPVTKVSFYVAGVPDNAKADAIEKAFRAAFEGLQSFEIQSDMVAACRSLFGKGKGIACILGTGSNSCVWDGEKQVAHINSGGFILGDEGSAARLGLLFIADQIKGLVPQEIDREFCSRFDASYKEIVNRVYSRGSAGATVGVGVGGGPSGYLGSFAPFLLSHYEHPYVKGLVDGNFRDFFERCVLRYKTGEEAMVIGISGGFGYACREIISRIAAEYGVSISSFISSPISNLESL